MIQELIKAEFSRRKQNNPAYSLRAMAQFLEIQPGRLSEYLGGKRKISLRVETRILKKLHLSEMFPKAIHKLDNNESQKELSLVADETFNIISDSIHFEILSLMDTEDFKSKTDWIAGRLGKDETQVRWALERLTTAGLISRTSGRLRKENVNLNTTADIEFHALKQSHLQTLKQAEAALFEVPVELRDISSVTFALDLKKLPLAKNLIKDFRRELCTLLETPSSNEVFHLNIQLLPATKIKNKKGVIQ